MLARIVARASNVNVLVVDDDRAIQRLLSDWLTKQGYSVTVERDGEWAVKTFEKKAFDVVILDLLLPALNGYEVARQLRLMPRGKRTPIIMISGVYKNELHQKEAIQKHGAVAYFEKPINFDGLKKALEKALGDKAPAPKQELPPPPPLDEDSVTGEFMADEAQRQEVEVVESQARQTQRAPKTQTMRGDFNATSFAAVIAEAYRWRATGALLLRRAKVKKIVYFREGNPELVKSNLLVECLGQILVREKLISEPECNESLKRMKATGRMQGTVLIDMGCISPHNLQYALNLQLQEKLFDIFRWTQGEYTFNPEAPLPSEPISLGMTSAQLILEGVKRAYDDERLDTALAGQDSKYIHPSDDPLFALQDAGLNSAERELFTMFDGRKTLATMRSLNVISELDFNRMILALSAAQMISLRDNAASGKTKSSIVKLADRASSKPAPPPLPLAGPPALPPPLPPKSGFQPAVKPPKANLDLPWSNAELAQPLAPTSAPPPAPPPVAAKPPPPPRNSTSLLPELSEVVGMGNLSKEESVQREKLAAKVAAMRRMDYFEVLGVKTSAKREEIKQKYFALAKEFHPDRHFQSASAETRMLAQQLYDLISTAHDTLTDPAERDRYVKEIAQGVKNSMGADVSKMLAAEGKFQRGEEAMRQRNFAEANRQFGEAIALYADEGEFHAWYGWSLFQMDPSRAEAAATSIEKAISLNSKLDKSYLFLGYIHKATGRPDKAEKQFEKAIQCNPDCTEALRELRLLGKARR